MNCELARERFAERLDGPLEEVDGHLQGCPACLAEWTAFSAEWAALESLAAPPAPSDLGRRVLAEMDRRSAGSARRAPPGCGARRARGSWPGRALVAATAACYLGLFGWLGLLAWRPAEPPSPRALQEWAGMRGGRLTMLREMVDSGLLELPGDGTTLRTVERPAARTEGRNRS